MLGTGRRHAGDPLSGDSGEESKFCYDSKIRKSCLSLRKESYLNCCPGITRIGTLGNVVVGIYAQLAISKPEHLLASFCNSLLSGKNTGNSAFLRSIQALDQLKAREITALFERIP